MTILLVDDELRFRQAISRSLTSHGHTVVEAERVDESVRLLDQQDFDLICLDINLPDATGWDLLRHLEAEGRRIPTIVFSAVPPAASRVKAFRPFGVFTKPFPIDALLTLVERVELAGSQAKREVELS